MPIKPYMAIIKSVSLSEDHAEMIKREKLSLSAVLRTALEQVSLEKSGQLLESNAHLIAKIERLMNNIQKFSEFLQERGLYDEFLAKK